MPRRRTVRHLLASLAAAVGAVATAVVVAPTAALAHTDVEYTLPAADETVAEPVSVITVAFGDPVTLVGAGFEVFTPAGEIVRPEVFTEDGAVYLLQLDPPLAGGDVGVRYEVTAADGHVLDGTFAFTVSAPPPTTVPPTAAPTVPLTAPATTAATGAPPTVAPVAAPTTQTIVIAAPDASTAPATTSVAAGAADDGPSGGSTGLIVGIGAAGALAVGAVVLLRSRRPTGADSDPTPADPTGT